MITHLKRNYLKYIKEIPIPLSLSSRLTKFPFEFQVVELPITHMVVNFDDLSPVTEKRYQIGRGGISDIIWKYYDDLLIEHSDIGVTHFLIPNFQLCDNYSNENLITGLNNARWLSLIKQYADRYNTEFAIHGLYHRQYKNRYFARNTEFAYLNCDESLRLLYQATAIFKNAGLFSTGFRPPGWDMNSNCSLINALINCRFKYCALNSYDGGINSNATRISTFHPTVINKKIVNFPDNIPLDWKLDKMLSVIDEIISVRGIISVKAHFAIRGLPNSFNEMNAKKLIKLIAIVKSKYGSAIKFSTFQNVLHEIKEVF